MPLLPLRLASSTLAGLLVLAPGAPTRVRQDSSPAPHPLTGWIAPLSGSLQVVRGFQRPTSAYGPGHRGVDLAAPVGAVVRAPASGSVVYAGLLAGRGVVSISVGDLRTTFEPVRPLVRAGQTVRAGDPIATLEAGHCLTGCLHWGLRSPSGYLDPLITLGRRRVRLVTPVFHSQPGP